MQLFVLPRCNAHALPLPHECKVDIGRRAALLDAAMVPDLLQKQHLFRVWPRCVLIPVDLGESAGVNLRRGRETAGEPCSNGSQGCAEVSAI